MEILENPQYDDTFEEIYEIRNRLFSLLTNEEYDELRKVVTSIPLRNQYLTNLKYEWEIEIASEQQNIELVETILKESLQQGIWFSGVVLREYLRDFSNSSRLKSIIDQHEKMYLEVKEHTEPQMIIRAPRKPQSGRRYPLILFFDGRHSDHTISQFYWKPALELMDTVFASLRSSQIHAFGQYAWDDESISIREVRDAYEILLQRDDVDETQVIVSGMSQGAGIALQAIAKEIIPAIGFLTIAQALKPESFFGSESPSLFGKNLKSVIVSGEKDVSRHPSHKKFHELALASGIDCELYSYPDIGHEYPNDFCELVVKSVKFMIGER
ncbi:MAG: alpha/beta hydrolase family protein [Candidatus Thorarchaeota archaeon]